MAHLRRLAHCPEWGNTSSMSPSVSISTSLTSATILTTNSFYDVIMAHLRRLDYYKVLIT